MVLYVYVCGVHIRPCVILSVTVAAVVDGAYTSNTTCITEHSLAKSLLFVFSVTFS